MGQLSAYYIESRYTEDLRRMAQALDRKASVSLLRRTEEVVQWIRTRIVS